MDSEKGKSYEIQNDRDNLVKNFEEETNEHDEDTECGIACFKPHFLQKYATINVFVGLYSFIGLLSQTLSVYINSQVPALEKQFGLSSAESGLLMSFNDIGYFTTVLFLSAVVRFVHIPRFIYLCMLLYSISGLFCTLPHFIAQSRGFLNQKAISINFLSTNQSNSSLQVKSDLLCDATRILSNFTEKESCEKSSRLISPSAAMKTTALSLIGFGMVLQGIGKGPRNTAVTVYLDDNGERRKTGFYVGVVFMFAIFGPALSYVLGGIFSKMYVTLEDVDMDSRDPRWIGAWWLGFIVFGAASFIFTTVLLLFPRQIKESKKNSAKGKQLVRTEEFHGTLKEKVKDRLLSYWRVVRNPVYIILESQRIVQILSVGGYISFLSKYVTWQFGVQLSTANYLIAGINFSSVAIGAFLGGLLTRKFQMTPTNGFKILLLLFVIHNVFYAIALFLGCEQSNVFGPNSVHRLAKALPSNCSSNCQCYDADFFPICGSDDTMYHSPCYAGCDESIRSGRMFSNCSCIPDGKATAGFCQEQCNMIYPWAIVTFVSSVAGAMKIMPNFILMIRCVADTDKSTALGLSSFLISALGWALSPVLYGKLLDTTCLLWQSACLDKGSCELYDVTDLRWKFYTFGIVLKMIGLLTCVVGLYRVRNQKQWLSQLNSAPNVDAPNSVLKDDSSNSVLKDDSSNSVLKDDASNSVSTDNVPNSCEKLD